MKYFCKQLVGEPISAFYRVFENSTQICLWVTIKARAGCIIGAERRLLLWPLLSRDPLRVWADGGIALTAEA